MIANLLRIVVRLTLAGTLVVAAGYAVHYLYSWQWQRAQIALGATLAALVVAATGVVLGRLDRLERDLGRRLDRLEAAAVAVPPTSPLPASGPGREGPPDADAPDFPWLVPVAPRVVVVPVTAAVAAGADEPRAAVFIPVLLGAGLLVTVVAGLVERVAARLNTPRPPRARVVALDVAVVVVLAAVVTAGVWHSAHYRPEQLGEGRTVLTVDVRTKAAPAPAVDTVGTMARYCARTAISGVRVVGVESRTATSAVLVLSPLLDQEARRRFAGCLEDANLTWQRLTVTGSVLVPAEPVHPVRPDRPVPGRTP
jgi:hypothetical protein